MSAPELILHIGRHKSGTSSLQHFLGGARDHLSGQGVLYPHAGCPNRIAHHAIAAQCHSGQSDGAGLADIAAAIRGELEPHHTRILLSSEAFQNLTDLTRLRDFADALDVGRIRVLCYLREHLDYAVSGYRQMIQNQPRFVPFRKFVQGLGDLAPFAARWRGFGDLELCWYDRSRLKDGDIIADVCARLDIAPGAVPQGDMNPSIGGNLLVYKLAANKLEMPALDYAALRDLAGTHAAFRRAFYIADEDAARLRALTGSAPQLLVSFDYDQSQMKGPPFSVPASEIHAHYDPFYTVDQISSEPISGPLGQRTKGSETVWILSPG